MFHPDAFKGTSKAFQAYVILCGKYGIAAMLCIFISLFSTYLFPAAYDPNNAFRYSDLVAYAVAFMFQVLAVLLIFRMTRITRPNAYD